MQPGFTANERFAAVYAEPDVVTTYEAPVQPDGSRERHAAS